MYIFNPREILIKKLNFKKRMRTFETLKKKFLQSKNIEKRSLEFLFCCSFLFVCYSNRLIVYIYVQNIKFNFLLYENKI